MNTSTFRIARPFTLLAAVGATLIGLSTGSRGWAADYPLHETWNWSGTLAAGRTLEINGVNGDIVAEPGPGNRIEVVAEKSSKRQNPANVEIKVVEDSHGVTICAMYPGQGSPCAPVRLSLRGRANDVRVDFHVKVPAGVSFTAKSVNGDVRARGLTGVLRASTVNGECQIETAGSGKASSVNGSVHATLGSMSPDDDLDFSTVNGSIVLALPASVNAEFSGSTVNGDIRSDFPSTTGGHWGPRKVSATLGRGGAKLSASTVNGSIRLERSGATGS